MKIISVNFWFSSDIIQTTKFEHEQKNDFIIAYTSA